MKEQAALLAKHMFRRTPKGNDELRSGIHRLSPRTTQLLAMLDGKYDRGQLLSVFPERELAAYLATLEVGNFVRPTFSTANDETVSLTALADDKPPTELAQLRKRVLIGLLTQLGIAAEPFVLRIMHCTTIHELRDLGPAICSVIEASSGPIRAEQFSQETLGLFKQ